MSQPLVPNLVYSSWLVLEQRKPDRDLAITDVVRHGGNAAALAVAEIRAEGAETERAVAHRIDVHAMPDTQPRGVFVDLLEQREQADTENPKEVRVLPAAVRGRWGSKLRASSGGQFGRPPANGRSAERISADAAVDRPALLLRLWWRGGRRGMAIKGGPPHINNGF